MIAKLTSRKFLVTLATLATVILESDLSDWQRAVAGVVALGYVLGEALVDRARAEQAASAIERGLAEGRRVR